MAIVAGADTTSSVLSSIFYCLLTHPETYGRLRAEVDRFYPLEEDPFNTTYHAEMPYLNAVMYVLSCTSHMRCLLTPQSSNEAMRLFPPIIDGSQRVVPRDGVGRIVGNRYVASSPDLLRCLPGS